MNEIYFIPAIVSVLYFLFEIRPDDVNVSSL